MADASQAKPVVADASQAKPVVLAAAGDGGLGIETVVVSARLRKENQQDVPVPLAAISGYELTRDNTDALTSLQTKFPSIAIVQSNPRQASVAIRGIGLTGSDDGQDASTGIFIDGVYQARPGQASFDYEDIAQITVCVAHKAPCSAATRTSGALVVETRAPSFDLRAWDWRRTPALTACCR